MLVGCRNLGSGLEAADATAVIIDGVALAGAERAERFLRVDRRGHHRRSGPSAVRLTPDRRVRSGARIVDAPSDRRCRRTVGDAAHARSAIAAGRRALASQMVGAVEQMLADTLGYVDRAPPVRPCDRLVPDRQAPPGRGQGGRRRRRRRLCAPRGRPHDTPRRRDAGDRRQVPRRTCPAAGLDALLPGPRRHRLHRRARLSPWVRRGLLLDLLLGGQRATLATRCWDSRLIAGAAEPLRLPELTVACRDVTADRADEPDGSLGSRDRRHRPHRLHAQVGPHGHRAGRRGGARGARRRRAHAGRRRRHHVLLDRRPRRPAAGLPRDRPRRDRLDGEHVRRRQPGRTRDGQRGRGDHHRPSRRRRRLPGARLRTCATARSPARSRSAVSSSSPRRTATSCRRSGSRCGPSATSTCTARPARTSARSRSTTAPTPSTTSTPSPATRSRSTTYLAGRWVVEPFRVFDCAYEVDGAVALVLTSADRAADLRHPPVYPIGAAEGTGAGGMPDLWDDQTSMYSRIVAPKLWAPDRPLARRHGHRLHVRLLHVHDHGDVRGLRVLRQG